MTVPVKGAALNKSDLETSNKENKQKKYIKLIWNKIQNLNHTNIQKKGKRNDHQAN